MIKKNIQKITHTITSGQYLQYIIGILTFILFITICVKVVIKHNGIDPQNIVLYSSISYDGGLALFQKKVFPIDLYVSNEFSSVIELEEIKKATTRWGEVSNGLIKINPKFYWEPAANEQFSHKLYNDYKIITLWKKEINDPSLYEIRNELSSHGYFDAANGNNYIVVVNTDYSKRHLYPLLIHQIGHILKLQHLKKEYMGVMYIGGNNGLITKYDMIQFCYLYLDECNKSKLKFF